MHFQVGTNGATEAITVLNNGNVGIGTVGPAARFHSIAGSTFAGGVLFSTSDWSDLTTGSGLAILFGAATGNTHAIMNALRQGSGDVDNLALQLFGGGVGIGTADFDGTPAVGRLTVKGTTNNGTTNVLVGRDSDEANVFAVDTNGVITTAAPGGTVPAWVTYTVPYTDAAFIVAATSATKVLFEKPANKPILAVRMKHSVAFAGTAVTAVSCSVGSEVGPDTTYYLGAFDVFQAVGNTILRGTTGYGEPTAVADDVILNCTANTNFGSGAATVLTAGSVRIDLFY